MRPALRFFLFSLAMVAVAPAASADDSALAKADALSISAHRTAGNLRHRWDGMRAKNAEIAACLEGKFLQAVSVARRIDEHRLALRDETDAKERTRRLAAIEHLAERRAELWDQAATCDPTLDVPAANATIIRTVASSNIAPIDPGVPELSTGFPSSLWSALLRFRW